MEKHSSKKQLLFIEPSVRPDETKEEFVERLVAAMERAGIRVNRQKKNNDKKPR